jgi:ParB family chromosome partitioning protein
MAPATEAETEAEAEERKRNYEQQRKEYEQEQERRAEESRLEEERREKEWEAERARREKLQKARNAKFDRILENAPAMFNAAQLRVFLRALVNLDPYTFADDVAEHFAAEDENNDKSAEEILLATVDGLTDDKLTGFALRLVLTGNIPITREGEVDSLAEAETAFVPAKPKKTATKTAKAPTPMKAAQKTASRKSTAKKQVAA